MNELIRIVRPLWFFWLLRLQGLTLDQHPPPNFVILYVKIQRLTQVLQLIISIAVDIIRAQRGGSAVDIKGRFAGGRLLDGIRILRRI